MTDTIRITAESGLPWEKYAGVIDISSGLTWGDATPLDMGNSLAWMLPWAETGYLDVGSEIGWVEAAALDAENVQPWGGQLMRDVENILPWDPTIRTDADSVLPWLPTIPTNPDFMLSWARTAAVDAAIDIPWQILTALEIEARMAWAVSQTTDVSVVCPWTRLVPLDVSNFSPFIREYIKQALRKSWTLPWLAVARIIMSKQNIIFYRVSDNEPVHVINPTASIDLDSWRWEFSGTLPSRADADLIRPGAVVGERETEVYLSINGYEFKFFVSGVSENYQWAKGTYNFKGRSKSVIFGDDYCPKITEDFAAQPVQSVIADLLDGSGWSWQWDLLTNTWNLAGGSLSVQDATIMDILARIASSVGGTIQTDPVDNVLRFMSRFPVSPENWAGATPAYTIISGIMNQGSEADPTPGYNQVIVSGKTAGVIATVRRTGTSGDIPAPAIVDPMLTNQAVTVERGRVVLAENGHDFVKETLLLPLPGVGHAPALLLPGDLVQIADLKATWKGQVFGVAISAETAKTRQRVTVKRLKS